MLKKTACDREDLLGTPTVTWVGFFRPDPEEPEEARAAEHQIKKWSRAKKEALIDGNFDLLKLLAGRSKMSRALRDASK